jgi:hypothetical protein
MKGMDSRLRRNEKETRAVTRKYRFHMKSLKKGENKKACFHD